MFFSLNTETLDTTVTYRPYMNTCAGLVQWTRSWDKSASSAAAAELTGL